MVPEGSELYGAMQNIAFKLARDLGEYDTRAAELKKLYGREDIADELTADLIGDYLFRDEAFVRSLSTDQNLFRKVWNEVKHLYKMATAGSKEARQLEKLKHTFEKIYREGAKAVEGTKYSLLVTETNGKQTAVNPESVTRDGTRNYLEMSLKRRLEDDTYFPVSAHTPPTIISTLQNAGIEVSDKPLAMQVKKARKSQLDAPPYKKDGVTVRFHAMSAEEIQEVLEQIIKLFHLCIYYTPIYL